MLYGREREQARIEALVAAAHDGAGGALVLRGGPGIGKTALLDWAAALPVARVLRASGVEVEAELPFAGLSQLLRPVLDRRDRLPGPQRAAIEAAFGLAPGAAADRLLIGFAVLSLLAEAADNGPVLCLVDDAQWLDAVSADALLFAARRLSGEGVALVAAARETGFPAFGLPGLVLEGLSAADAARLLAPDLDPAFRDRVLAQAEGNPLALIELPKVTSFSEALPLTDRLQAAFSGQIAGLPEPTRALLLIAAADDTGDLAVLLRAAPDSTVDDLRPAEEARLIDVGGGTLRFRHPLIRTAVYHSSLYAQRLAAHRALGEALSASGTADRSAWHRAAATTGLDDDVAAALEETARQARDRNGYAAAAAAYQRAAQMTSRPAEQARRLLLAAESGLPAGRPSTAVRLAERAASLVDSPEFLARVGWIEGQAWFWQGNYQTAYELLTAAADLAPDRAAAILVQALHPAWYLGEPQLGACLDRLAAVDDPVARFQVAALRGRPEPLASFVDALARDKAPAELVQICGLGFAAGQDAQAYELSSALVGRCRAEGLVGLLPILLFFLAEAQLFAGRHGDAAVSAAEGLQIARDAGQPLWISQLSAVEALLAAVGGDEDRCRAAVADSLAAASPGATPAGYTWAQWALGLLDLASGRPDAALPRLLHLQENPYAHHVAAYRCIPDLVEAAVRSGQAESSQAPVRRLADFAARTGQPWAHALGHRCHALLGGGEEDYMAALKLPGRPFEQARTELLYGEWLRRARRKADARPVLQRALETFDRLGAQPWAVRTRTELEATGLRALRAAAAAVAQLTPQELQIARLAAQGLSNKDIAAQLFLSPKTVAYHLYKAYPKLGVAGRGDLADLGL